METANTPENALITYITRTTIRFRFKQFVKMMGLKFSLHRSSLPNWKIARLSKLTVKDELTNITFKRINDTFIDDFKERSHILDKVEELEYYRRTLLELKSHIELGILPSKFVNTYQWLITKLDSYSDTQKKSYLDFEFIKF